MGPDAMILVFWMLSFKPTFSFSCFTFIKRLFGFSSLSSIRVVSSAYLRLLIFLPAILIPACASSSPTFLMMCSAYKLNKQGDNMQPWCTPFPIWNQSVFPCPVLTVASLPIYRLLYNIVVVFAVHQHESDIGTHVSPPSWWTDKEVMVHIHNGILLSYKKEYIWVSSNEEDEPRAYNPKWSKSERERQLYIKAYTWDLYSLKNFFSGGVAQHRGS